MYPAISYTYSDAGRLETRIWDRGITTTYVYENSGLLSNITYSGSSASAITNTYDRFGRLKSVGDASGLRTIGYNDAGQPTSETYTSGPLAGIALAREFTDGLLTGVSAREDEDPAFYDVSYLYDGVSRLAEVENGNHRFGYAYYPTSSLLSSVTFTNGSTEVMVTSEGYDKLNRLTNINTSASSPINTYSYSYTGMARRVRVDLAGGDYWEYAYDDLGQVISGVKREADGTAYSGQQSGYEFDDIGNRTEATANGATSDYTANLVNQYTSRTVPGVFDILGEAVTGSTVTVNKELTTRHGEYFHGQVSVSNTNDLYQELTIVGVLNNVNTNGEDAVATSTRHWFLPADPESFTYDSDGNLTSDGRWTNTWNGENRLIAMKTKDGLVSSVPAVSMYFEYDSQGRRFKKTVTSNSVSTTTYFLYDGWNLLAELDSSLNPIRTYTWGSDLSGSLQGAGGVGGLLAVSDSSSSDVYYASYDGNGNLTALVDSSDSSIQAHYEYDPFGQILRMTGDYAEQNPFRFSTKFHDESGWVYYGYRYLIPGLGRWASRDPIGEEGGLGLYGFVGNGGTYAIDVLGLASPWAPLGELGYTPLCSNRDVSFWECYIVCRVGVTAPRVATVAASSLESLNRRSRSL